MLANGRHKLAGTIEIGDWLRTVETVERPEEEGGHIEVFSAAPVRGLVVCMGGDEKSELVRIGNLIISRNHPVRIDGQWMPPYLAPVRRG